jgi:uncharacterized protein YidB (DUF937 family)
MNWIARLLDLFSFKFAPASTAVVERRSEADQALLLLQDYFKSSGGINAEAIKGFEQAGFIGKVRSWRGDGPILPINSVEALQLLGWKNLRTMSNKSGIPTDRLRELIAESLPLAVRRACAAA